MRTKDKLTVKTINGARATDKAYKMFDGGGLYLLVQPNSSKWWRLKYRIDGQEKLISLGGYPEKSLKDARVSRDKARSLIKQGLDPSIVRKEARVEREQLKKNTLEHVAREWHKEAAKEAEWTKLHKNIVIKQLENYIFPSLGDTPVARITRKELLAAIKSAKGKTVTMHRLAHYCKKLFRYAVLNELISHNIALEIEGSDLPPKGAVQHFPAITNDTKKLAELLNAIDEDQRVHPITKAVLRLLPLLATRPNELREAKWVEIGLEDATWRIPAERMKKRRPHIVPLPSQAVKILRDLKNLTGTYAYVFPGIKNIHKPISDDTLPRWFRSNGYSGIQTPHGFRATFSSFLNEQGWNPDAIERQLAHVTKNKVRSAYHRSEYLEERRQMLQSWANFLDSTKQGSTVIPIKRGA